MYTLKELFKSQPGKNVTSNNKKNSKPGPIATTSVTKY